MTLATQHPLASMLDDAAFGVLPVPDGAVEVFNPPSGPCDAVIAFTGHAVVAGDVSADWVRRHVHSGRFAEHEHHPVLVPHFLAALADRLGSPPAGVSMLLAATPTGAAPAGQLDVVDLEPPGWADYRLDVRSYCYRGSSGSGSISIAHGPAGRWDVWIGNVDGRDHQSTTVRGMELLHAAQSLIPDRAPLYASVPIHSARAIRTALATGFRPLGAEVLFCTREPGA